jgi:acyl carrier protein
MKNPTERLFDVFVNVLALPPQTDSAGLRRSAVVSWDSLMQITLITAIENEFGIQFDADEYATIVSYEAAADSLKNKGVL